ncbi:hypothetical protein OHB26_39455 (plasmid) [Nocardia sp. NBC_01503]|uniref:hypothetical protein n=1 Tax=Nocardia sp. NBC_01503 TaxID=2975997 RepID=UPI002E7BADC4|nr:hypothetical protein [Nocardia sp. NBC_01503]WTL36691.1 hypothetical protein OHB26_39120 [Nocardia sp. NBC_01503]WTL36756.1 hypothetical protein OHB26_39455 [Nocardia sp. NBC_01503]
MNTSSTAVLKALLAVILSLVSLLAAVVAGAMSRHDGQRWTTAIAQGFKAFATASTLLAALYVAFIALP